MATLSWTVIRDDPRSLGLHVRPVNCRQKKCPLFRGCAQIASTYTKRPVDVLFVGEGAGKEEALHGEPFVGKSGGLLKGTLAWLVESRLGKSLEEVGVAFSNLVRARPTDERGNNRAPTLEEFKYCRRFLEEDIRRYRPKIIIALGDVPYRFLTGETRPVWQVRGTPRRTTVLGHECYLAASRHPAYYLRQPQDVADFVVDLRLYTMPLWLRRPYPRLEPPKKIRITRTVEEVARLVKLLRNSPRVAFDVEAQNLNRRYDNRVLTIQFSADGETAWVVPLYHPETPFTPEEIEQVKKLLRRLFTTCPGEAKLTAFLAHNAVFDLHMLRNFLLDLRYVALPVIDTYVQAYLLEDNFAKGGGRLGLKELARRYGYDYQEHHAAALEARNRGALDKLSLKEVADYGGADAAITRQLYSLQNEVAYLEGEDVPLKVNRMLRYFYHPLLNQFVELESTGLPVNPSQVAKLVDKDHSPIVQARQELVDTFYRLPSVRRANRLLMRRTSGMANSVWGDGAVDQVRRLSITSSEDKKFLFFEILKVKPTKVSRATGKPSLDKDVLKKLAEQGYVEAKILQRLHQLDKMFSSFVQPTYDKLLNDPDAKDGFIRPVFHAVGTVTGRLSASNPNCLSGSTRVVVQGYGALKLSDIYKLRLVGEKVLIGGKAYRIRNVWERKATEVIVVNTICGRQLIGSKDHRLLVKRGSQLAWVPMAQIQIGDRLVAELPAFHGLEMNPSSKAASTTTRQAKEAGQRFVNGAGIPPWLFRAPRHLILAFFEGVVGRKINEEDRLFIETKEYGRKVTYDLLLLASFAGLWASGLYFDDCMGVAIYGLTYEHRYVTYQVRSVRSYRNPVYLYDLEVEGEHAFLADGIISHNSQQIPKVKGDEFAKKVRYETRAMFEAPSGWALIELDFSTNEVRGLGIVSGDPQLKQTFENLRKIQLAYRRNPTEELKIKLKAADPHRVNAAITYGMRPEEVPDEVRGEIKSVTFGTIYGMAISTLAKNLGKTEEEAQEIYDRLFAKLAVAKKWIDATIHRARRRIVVESPLGRRRRLYHYLIPDARPLWSEGDRRAVNSPIQGLSSDLALMGTFLFYFEYIVPHGKPWFICNTVHDSALILVPLKDVPECLRRCEYYFTDRVTRYVREKYHFDLGLPLGIDLKVGISLADMKKWDFTEKGLREVVKFVFQEYRRREKFRQPAWQPDAQRLGAPCPGFLEVL